MKNIKLLIVLLSLSLPAISYTLEPSEFLKARDRFNSASPVMDMWEIAGPWECHGYKGFQDESELIPTKYLFDHKVIPINPNITQSQYFEAPEWVPRWFSKLREARSTVSIKTKEFLNCQQESFWDCLEQDHEGKESLAYIRVENRNQLIMEWVRIDNPEPLKYEALSVDRYHSDRKAFMYTYCERP